MIKCSIGFRRRFVLRVKSTTKTVCGYTNYNYYALVLENFPYREEAIAYSSW